jgi:hypothetical protein
MLGLRAMPIVVICLHSATDLWHATLSYSHSLRNFSFIIQKPFHLLIIISAGILFLLARCDMFAKTSSGGEGRLMSAEEKAPAELDKFVSIMVRLNKFH